MVIEKFSLAPMASVADSAMRIICAEHGCPHVTTEMISAAAVYYHDKKTYALARIDKAESPCAIQLFGHEADKLAYAVGALYESAEVKPDRFDFNMGCPVKKIVNNGEGSALMRSPVLSGKLIEALVNSANRFGVPVTVKIRAGFDAEHKNAVEVAHIAQECGAAAVCAHGRTREQMYSANTVDYDIIADVKRALSIPVIANGDIFDGEAAVRVLELTGADGIAVARGALGNPFIFEEIRAILSGGEFTPPAVSERMDAARRHLSLLIKFKGERTAILEARKQLAWYTKGIRSALSYRKEINTAETAAELYEILDRITEGSKT